MAMTFEFNINPFGYRAPPINFGGMSVHSEGSYHKYIITWMDRGIRKYKTGYVEKRMPDGTLRSGHRNFLHLLRDILNDAALDTLGKDYVNVLEEIREATGYDGKVGDYAEGE